MDIDIRQFKIVANSPDFYKNETPGVLKPDSQGALTAVQQNVYQRLR